MRETIWRKDNGVDNRERKKYQTGKMDSKKMKGEQEVTIRDEITDSEWQS